MHPLLIEGGLAGLSIAAWFGLYGGLLVLTRPRSVTPEPSTQDLGPEPPAVASLVGNGWDLTEDAAEATLLDLGARDVLEFRQPAADPTHTTVHIRQSSPTGLLPYERRVYDRIAGLAVGGVVPLTALTFRDPKRSHAWAKDLRAEVIADARARGLSRRRFSRTHVSILGAGAVIAAIGVAIAVAHYVNRGDEEDPIGTVLSVGFVTFAVLAALAGRNVGERDTPEGRAAAARWLGVRNWLRAHEAFAELPPSAVAVWGRYIGYGAALGTTRVASAVIDLGMGNRRRVWSSYGDGWHRVRVSYPRFWPRYGRPAAILLLRAGLALAAGIALVRWWRPFIADLAEFDPVRPVAGTVSALGFALGVALVAYAAYVVIRVIIDAASPLHLTGQVLWVEVWRQKSGGENSPPKPWLAYFAVDSGPSDRTTAWGLPYEMVGRCETGDLVAMRVRRWSRRVVDLAVVPAASAPPASDPAAPDPAASDPAAPDPAASDPPAPDPPGSGGSADGPVIAPSAQAG
jgi:hypothetical protein